MRVLTTQTQRPRLAVRVDGIHSAMAVGNELDSLRTFGLP
jgi:hypothetical protein